MVWIPNGSPDPMDCYLTRCTESPKKTIISWFSSKGFAFRASLASSSPWTNFVRSASTRCSSDSTSAAPGPSRELANWISGNCYSWRFRFNPFEIIWSSKWVHLPQIGVNIKHIWKHHLGVLFLEYLGAWHLPNKFLLPCVFWWKRVTLSVFGDIQGKMIT